jgi:hypothetical protein
MKIPPRGCPPLPSYDTTGKDLTEHQAQSLKDIAKGLQDSSLTQDEAAGLMERQSEIAAQLAEAQADGFVDPLEHLSVRMHQLLGNLEGLVATYNCAQGNYEQMKDIQGKQVDHLGRIADGMSQGKLTAREATQLLPQQAALAHDVSEILSDEQVHPDERRDFNLKQARASANIFRLTNIDG